MNDRQLFILRTALIYLTANLHDINQAFETDNNDELEQMTGGIPTEQISVEGVVGDAITENEVDDLLASLAS